MNKLTRLSQRILPRQRAGFPLSKIVATIGPASEQLPALTNVVNAGLNIMRINFSHATYDEANLRKTNIVLSTHPQATDNSRNLISVMLDTQGPEMRTGSFGGDVKEVELFTDDEIVLTTKAAFQNNQTSTLIWVSYERLPSTVNVGTSILLDDGTVEVVVTSVDVVGGEIRAVVKNNGALGNKKGVNIPGVSVELPAMSDKDKVDISWGIDNDIDFIAASFVRKPSDVTTIREFTKQLLVKKYGANALQSHPLPRIISKIESTEALVNFESILEVSDAIMVARGDLGVEIPMECIGGVQKEMVRQCNAAGKPVIVATQMLESMQKKPLPTRAECTDVFNAIVEGADCVMLSGESAKGKYPVKSVATMKAIVTQAESWLEQESKLLTTATTTTTQGKDLTTLQVRAHGAAAIAKHTQVSCIVVATTDEGQTAELIAGQRPGVAIATLVSSAKLGRLLQLSRGLHPILANVSSTTTVAEAVEIAKKHKFCQTNDNVVVVTNLETRLFTV